ncbi:MAG: biotin/lipoyl-containing protein, partial [Woeseiaceae bacterium]
MAKTIDIVVPDLGDFENVEVIEVLVGAGDSVEREDGLVTVETDKASMDIPAPENGVIEKLTLSVGDTISSGDVIGQLTMEVSDTVVITPAMAARPTGDTTILATPADGTARSGGKQTLVVPDLGDFADVEVIEVHIAPGSSVEVEDPLVTLETDKAAMDVPAVVAGTIDSVFVKVGDKVSEGTSIALIDALAAAAAVTGSEPAPSTAKAATASEP